MYRRIGQIHSFFIGPHPTSPDGEEDCMANLASGNSQPPRAYLVGEADWRATARASHRIYFTIRRGRAVESQSLLASQSRSPSGQAGWGLILLALLLLPGLAVPAWAQGEWEITPQSEVALERGLEWLARNKGPKGIGSRTTWVWSSMGALAFLSAGHTPGPRQVRRGGRAALDYVLQQRQAVGPVEHRQRRSATCTTTAWRRSCWARPTA